ncbi:MAG TPA: c-type cytochrome domain-containing protein [Candidatus Sulfotelmatobacter sp.]|jgi:uncharacterized membrane protein|nr:c-type cytochrome domain-containing protein [Candidatus Sulfotelmatobacter sp.]
MRKVVLSVLAACAALAAATGAGAATKKPSVSYAEDVAPILQSRCVSCHQTGGEGFEKSGLDLTSYEGLIKGTKFGPIIVPGDTQTSNLVVLLDGRADKSIQMPHGTKKKLSTCDRDTIRTWIHEGAKNN